MDATSTPLNPDAQRKQDRARKRKAILAGGVVLGLGAAVTLAAWSDDVFADGTFNTGSFDLIGSAYDQADIAELNYSDWDATPGADLSFRINSVNMYPGETVAAPFSIAQASGTTVDGRVWMYQAVADGTLTPHLSYDIKIINDPSLCVADNPATTENEAEALEVLPTWNGYDFSAGATNAENIAGQRDEDSSVNTQDRLVQQNFGNQQHLCILVTLADSEAAIGALDTSVDTSIVWNFRGESETPTS